MRLNPHVHAVFLDGAWHEQENELVFVGLGHLGTSEVGAVLERTIRRIERHLRRRGVLPGNEDDDDLHAVPVTGLAAAAASGQVPPAGPQWAIRLRPPERSALAYDKPLCASDLRAEPMARPDVERAAAPKATAARSWTASRSTRPRAQARSIPPAARRCCDTCCARPLPRTARTVWSASSSADLSPTGPSRWRWIRSRSCVVSPRASLRHATTPSGTPPCSQQRANGDRASCRHRRKRSHLGGREARSAAADTALAELLARTFGLDALACPACEGRMRLVAVLRGPARVARYLASTSEPTELPPRSPRRGPPYWKSRVLRRMATGHDEA